MTKRGLTIAGLITFAIAAGVMIWIRISVVDPLRSPARREWKNSAIAVIEQRVADSQKLKLDVNLAATLAVSTSGYSSRWVADDVLVMANGDWMVCQNICHKQKEKIHDLFVGRGSDGKWYYSTFHFCVHKTVLEMERRPDSLVQFVDAYWLVPFDGRSDDALKETWTSGKSYGDEKLQAASQR